jgi:tRNA pseudouridine38-40 synthase
LTRFALTLEFDGGAFMGLQRQPHGPSVQAAVEEAVLAVTGETVSMNAAGRTDAGVHALAMRVHFDVAKEIAPFRLMEALNARLRLAGAAIAVLDCVVVADDWHARFSCLGRRYRYRIVNRRAPLAIDAGRAWLVKSPLDLGAMHEAAQSLIGHHDFTTFRAAECQANSPIRTLDRLDVERLGEEIHIRASARSFLHHQVRSFVGSLALVGSGRWSVQDLEDALNACERARCGPMAPSAGLYLVGVDYD